MRIIWGEQYKQFLAIKNIIDPTKVLRCYQSVGYVGDEVDIGNVAEFLKPKPSNPGRVDFASSSGVSILSGEGGRWGKSMLMMISGAVTTFLVHGVFC